MQYKSIYLVVLCSMIGVAARGDAPGQPPAPGGTPDRLITLDIQKATLPGVLAALGEQYGINAVCDSYADDSLVGRVSMTDVPLRKALPRIAQLFDRDLLACGGIAVMRHSRWYMRPAQEQFSAANYRIRWRTRGSVVVTRRDAPAGAAPNPAPPAQAIESRQGRKSEPLPARSVDVIVREAALQQVASALAAKTGWPVTVGRSLAARRVSAHLRGVSPGQVLEALTLLVNARQEVAIGQSEAQRQDEAGRTAQEMDARSEREKASDALKIQLLGLLSPDQWTALQNGETLELTVESLPAGLQSRALDYIATAVTQMQSLVQQQNQAPVVQPDSSRYRQFRIGISSEPSMALLIYGFDLQGGRIGF